jgi:hypothetical protein
MKYCRKRIFTTVSFPRTLLITVVFANRAKNVLCYNTLAEIRILCVRSSQQTLL